MGANVGTGGDVGAFVGAGVAVGGGAGTVTAGPTRCDDTFNSTSLAGIHPFSLLLINTLYQSPSGLMAKTVKMVPFSPNPINEYCEPGPVRTSMSPVTALACGLT